MIRRDASDNRRSIYGLNNNMVTAVPLIPNKSIKTALTTVTHEKPNPAQPSKPPMHSSIADRPDVHDIYN